MHWEKRRGTRQEASDYCQKEDTRVAGPYILGDLPAGEQGKRSDLNEATTMLSQGSTMYDVALVQPSAVVRYSKGLKYFQSLFLSRRARPPPTIILCFGPTGTGKTRFAHSEHPPHELWCAPLNGNTIWYDGYEQQQAALFDDFAGARSHYTLTNLLRLLDRYPVTVPYKGGHTPFLAQKIYITTNIHPKKWYDWSDRQEQYAALIRRISIVKWWKSRDAEPTDLVAGNPVDRPALEHFFRGPREIVPIMGNRLGVMVEYDDEYDF